MTNESTDSELTGDILGSAIKIHSAFGPGLSVDVYTRLLETELSARGHDVETSKSVAIEFEGETIKNAFRLELFVDGRMPVAVKSADSTPVSMTHCMKTYLKAMHLPLGLVINFGMPRLMDGYRRVLNNIPDTDA
ncbi:MAG: GxxExxY protein [Kiritimatiellae bacterium]|nr:GxxExxY protein [Kiritimatiellia bacterium]